MGEYAEMMLDGTCCSSCGEFMDIGGMMDGSHEPAGYAVMCDGCKKADRYEPRVPRFNRYAIKPTPKPRKPPRAADPLVLHGGKMACPYCRKPVKIAGLGNHVLASHRDQLEVRS